MYKFFFQITAYLRGISPLLHIPQKRFEKKFVALLPTVLYYKVKAAITKGNIVFEARQMFQIIMTSCVIPVR